MKAWPKQPVLPPATTGVLLMPRHEVLAALGIERKVSRAAWSHDRGDAIVFDAWQHQWTVDTAGNFDRYPMRTQKHYNLQKARTAPSRGHTRWQHHVDLVLGGQRSAIAIVPVRSDGDDPNRRTKGWLPQYVIGEVVSDGEGQYWFQAEKAVPL
jgi:hypothetical protein